MSTKAYLKLTLFWPLVAAAAPAAAQVGSVAPDFTIKDQYDHELQLSAERGRRILLIYGDRLGSNYMGDWEDAVRHSVAGSSVSVINIANLRAVPPVLRAYVKHMFQKPGEGGKPNSPVLLDWNAAVAKSYGFTDDLTNVYLIDEKGVLRYMACGKGTTQETARLLDVIAQLDRPK
jgi:hypothetical protein